MADHQTLRVFIGPDGRGGNLLGVVFNDDSDAPARQAVAAELGYSETVFIDDEHGKVRIFTPSVELPFAGHPLVGTAWLLKSTLLRPPAGDVPAWTEGDFTWIRGRAAWAPGRRTEQYATAAEVDALPAPPPGEGWLYAWAWADEAAGRIRARAFPRRGDGIIEDEATGAAAIILTTELARPLDIHQGTDSQIVTRPGPDGTVDVGGRVAHAQ
ncbi:PhzF family phenazine biosynthesis protein [Streptomyces sp. H10-C2]|uniref:PhzF family phenazine biosynthesis protein n=1 Tax=unclassified Streptomyces TaxID=2593676 RepID=UPI0024B94F18|nr:MULTISPECIES: PhzF family phenazine biosynthesis protein [unclassified Streptomyces]MDJ0344630.1 PhzF family phenazine biosynthesis protein [Streptomyces sp. PH10-H1]MDJ0373210.1 PhzF family phenazine biosynthesis protein [Streptomyces sp. H10-C2]